MNNRPKDRLPRLRFNSSGTVSVISWGCADTQNILVEVPSQKGRYLFTDPSVLMVGCPLCGAEIGEPCKGNQTRDGYGCLTHVRRRDAYSVKKQTGFCEHRAWLGA